MFSYSIYKSLKRCVWESLKYWDNLNWKLTFWKLWGLNILTHFVFTWFSDMILICITSSLKKVISLEVILCWISISVVCRIRRMVLRENRLNSLSLNRNYTSLCSFNNFRILIWVLKKFYICIYSLYLYLKVTCKWRSLDSEWFPDYQDFSVSRKELKSRYTVWRI